MNVRTECSAKIQTISAKKLVSRLFSYGETRKSSIDCKSVQKVLNHAAGTCRFCMTQPALLGLSTLLIFCSDVRIPIDNQDNNPKSKTMATKHKASRYETCMLVVLSQPSIIFQIDTKRVSPQH